MTKEIRPAHHTAQGKLIPTHLFQTDQQNLKTEQSNSSSKQITNGQMVPNARYLKKRLDECCTKKAKGKYVRLTKRPYKDRELNNPNVKAKNRANNTQMECIRRVAEVLPVRTGTDFYKIVGKKNMDELFVYTNVKSKLEKSDEKFVEQR